MNNFIKKAEEPKSNAQQEPQTAEDLKNQQYSAGKNALIGGLIGAGLGGLGGYLFTPPDANEEYLSEDQKYDKRLKNALLAAAVGGLGGAGLGYGIAEIANEAAEDQKDKSLVSDAAEALISGKGYATGTGAIAGAGIGAFLEGTKIPKDVPKGAVTPKYYGRRAIRGGAAGLAVGGAIDIFARLAKHHTVGSDNN